MSLLGEGKLDIQQLLKKEAKLDSLRHSLEQEYSDKFEELDRNQRSVIERWNSRLLEVESQYAGRLAEAQKKYDGLRAELEGEHQGRLNRLETSFKAREKDLNERIGGLEKCVHLSEEKVETRRRELEGEYLIKKREAEENFRKLRNMLEAGLEEKIRAADSDHAEQVRSFETSWQIERARLLEEQHVREAQYASAQDRIKDIENALAVQQETHHTELLKIISEKETAFRAQLAALEAEKSAKEATVRELQARLEKKAAAWDADRARLQAEYDVRVGAVEAGLKESASALEKAYEEKKKDLENDLAAGRAEYEKEFNARLQAERQAMDAEKAVLEEEKRAREEALAVNSARLKELESAITATREEHHKDLMERIRSGEASFREKLAGFESEKQAYNQAINKLTDELRQKEASNIEEKRKITEDFEAKASALEAGYSARVASLEADYSARLAAVKAEAAEAVNAVKTESAEEIKAVKAGAAEEVKAVKAETAEQINAVRTEAIGKIESVQAESADTIEAVHAEAADKIEAERKNWHAERSRFENMLAEASGNYKEAQKKIETYDAALRQAGMDNAGLEERFNRGLIEARANYEKELSVRVKESVAARTADLLEALEAATARQAELSAELDAKADAIKALNYAAVEGKRECEARASASVAEAVAARRAELERTYARKQAAFEEDCQARLEVMNSEFTIKCERLAGENASLRKDIERQSADAANANARAKEESEKLLAAEKAFHNEKIELQKAQIAELEQTVADAVSTAVEMAEDRLRHAQEELEKSKKVNREEVKLLEEGFDAEKDQLLEEIGRRDRYIENADMKVQELERAMIKYRQTASGELMKNISDQDTRFRELAAEEKARGDARIKQLESLLSAKEKLLAEGDKFYRQKQLELDNLHAALNMRVNGFNQEIFSQKQELSEKEKELNEYRLKLEKDYANKNSELEQMKAELSRAIIDYRKR
jgi:hypothetical protein